MTNRSNGYYVAGIRNARIDRDKAEAKLTKAINEAIDNGVSYEEAAEVVGVSRATLHRRYRWTQQRLAIGATPEATSTPTGRARR